MQSECLHCPISWVPCSQSQNKEQIVEDKKWGEIFQLRRWWGCRGSYTPWTGLPASYWKEICFAFFQHLHKFQLPFCLISTLSQDRMCLVHGHLSCIIKHSLSSVDETPIWIRFELGISWENQASLINVQCFFIITCTEMQWNACSLCYPVKSYHSLVQ